MGSSEIPGSDKYHGQSVRLSSAVSSGSLTSEKSSDASDKVLLSVTGPGARRR